jgi:DNA primase
MARIPRHLIDEIRARTDLVALIGRRVQLKQRGTSHVGLCPFHQERSPSFNVVPIKQIYHCFGCGAGGDCFRFLMEIEGLSFIEAIKELAEGAGVPIDERELSPAERRQLSEREQRYRALDLASRFFEKVLLEAKEGEPGRRYLKEARGFSLETAQRWRLGYAPKGWTTLVDQLRREGLDDALLLDVGLARRSKGGDRVYDAFRERVTIPICDERGRVIGFGARLLDGDGPKYINSAASFVPVVDTGDGAAPRDGAEAAEPTVIGSRALYDKSAVLFGLHAARAAIQRKGRALLVEGYFDVISLHVAGFDEAIATCGTALTRQHLESLRRLTGSLVALFDSDDAGARAAERTLPLCFEAAITPYRLELPGAKDPDELIRAEGGPEAMAGALERTVPLLDWVVDRRVLAAGGRAPGEDALDEIAGLIAMTDGSDIVAQAAGRLKVHPAALGERVQRARARRAADGTGRAQAPEPAEPAEPAWKPTRDQVHVLWLVVHRLTEVANLATRVRLPSWSELDPLGGERGIIGRLLAGEAVAALDAELTDEEQRRVLRAVVSRPTLYEPHQAERALQHIADRWLRERIQARIAELSHEMQRSVAQGDLDAQQIATRAQLALRRLRNNLEKGFKADDREAWLVAAAEILPGSSDDP